MKIVLITDGRRADLFEQTVRSMRENAADWSRHELAIVVDGERDAARRVSGMKFLNEPGLLTGGIIPTGQPLGVGGAKNMGAAYFMNVRTAEIEHQIDEELEADPILMFSDDDMYYLPGWDRRLEEGLLLYPEVTQLGGWKHPYHGAHGSRRWISNDGKRQIAMDLVDAATGNCFVIRMSDWATYGPFDANALGPGQSEDYALSQKIQNAGGAVSSRVSLVASLDPPVAIHCGLVNCEGKPATGWREMLELAIRQLKAMPKRADDIAFWLPEEAGVGTPVTVTVPSIEDAAAIKEAFAAAQETAGVAFGAGPLPISARIPEPTIGRILVERSLVIENPKPHPQIYGYVDDGTLNLNIGSGQRRFDTAFGWLNIDIVKRPPDQIPDIVLDARKLDLHFQPDSAQFVVLHHVLEHFGCGEADDILRQCWSVLKPGGSLLIFVPDLRRLADRWLMGGIDIFTFLVNVYGAYQGEEGDRHRWGYDGPSLEAHLASVLGTAADVQPFDWRKIPGADIAQDWWILGAEIRKPKP